jgi:hypothetical protein
MMPASTRSIVNLYVERSRRLQVEDELEFGRLHDRQVGGLGAA